jgi:AcrR family transcriptional regulator
MPTTEPLRDRTRRAVRAELSDTALNLFLTVGYDATSIDQIALAVGMSRRSFFRYFATKDELVLSRYDSLGQDFLDAFVARPLEEPVWTSLRRTFDHAVAEYTENVSRERATAMQAMVEANPSLFAGYLRGQDRLQDAITELLVERAHRRGEEIDTTDPALRALVGTAFACLRAAVRGTLTSADPEHVGRRLDAVMAAMQPRMTMRRNDA